MSAWTETSPYDQSDLRRAVNLAALLGGLVVAGPLLLKSILSLNFAMVLLAALIGLPIALLACWLIAAPILRRLMRRSISWLSAVIWGAIIAATVEVLGVALSRLNGLRLYFDDSFYSQIGHGDKTQSIDGILTPHGWLIQAQNSAAFVAFGIVIALIVRAIVGPGIEQEVAK